MAQVVIFAALIAGCDIASKSPSEAGELGSTNLPTVVMQLGDTWGEVKKNSTYPLAPLAMPVGTGISAPHTFVYRDSRHYMAIEAWYMGVSVNSKEQKIQDIAVGLYSGTAGSEETWGRLRDISRKMEGAGWISDNDVNKRLRNEQSADELKEVWTKYPGGGEGEWKAWYDDYGNEAYIVLSKTIGHAADTEPRLNIILYVRPVRWPSKHAKKLGQS